MNKNRIEGKTKQAKGFIKKNVGKLTRNPELEAEGFGEEVAGRVQGAIGDAESKLKD